MGKQKYVTIDKVISKIDNDFNLDNTDWVDRVPQWCYDALSILDILPKIKVVVNTPVTESLIITPDDLDSVLYIKYGDHFINDYELNDDYITCKLELYGCPRELDSIEVELAYYKLDSIYSEEFDTELLVIPNNGLLIEALAYYCLSKILGRANKHQTFSLASPNIILNPLLMWNDLKDRAKASISHSFTGGLNFGSNLYRYTFDPNPKLRY